MNFIKNFFHFNKHQSEQKYLSDDVIEQIKDFNCRNLTKEQKLLIDKLILNKKLKNLYKKYGLCKECKQPNTAYEHCQSCKQKYLSNDVFEQIKDFNFHNLTKEQKLSIDKLILNRKLKNLYKKYGLCKECKQPNTGIGWCDKCFTKQIGQEYLSDDIFEQIKDFRYDWLTKEQKLLINKLILNEELKKRYKKYGLCKECKQPKINWSWCN
ncbi:hypothetical protein C1645_832916, partial [Glomus cerebriforme]